MARQPMNKKKAYKKPTTRGYKKPASAAPKKATTGGTSGPRRLGGAKKHTGGGDNAYCAGAWIKEKDDGSQRITFMSKSAEDKQKLLDYVTACVEGGDETSVILFGIANRYKNGPKAPDFVFVIPQEQQ